MSITSASTTPDSASSGTICPLLIACNQNKDAYFPSSQTARRHTLSRTRAFVACTVCRSRKVRCNVVEAGPPCRNCRFDEVPCIVAKTRRKRPVPPPLCLSSQSDCDDMDHETHKFYSFSEKISALPYFIRLGNNRLPTDEIKLLERKGAFTIPPVGLRNQLLQAYADLAHPHLPFINIWKITSDIDKLTERASTSGTSLLLFQAIMACGSVTVKMQHLRDAGYVSRQEASADLFYRVQALYNLDYETDKISVIQSLTMMCYWFQTPDWKGRHHWLTVAVSLLYTLQMQHDPNNMSTNPLLVAFYKRLWWCVYTADKMISATLQRSALINIGDFSTPMLTLADFHQQLEDCTGYTDLHNTSQQRQLALLFIEKAKLSICVGNILQTMYTVRGMASIRCCHVLLNQLNLWKQSLHTEAKYNISNDSNKGVFVLRCHLHLVYLTTLRDLWQAQHAEVIDGCSQCVWPNGAFRMVNMGMANIIKKLDRAELLSCLPPGTMTGLGQSA